MVVASRLLKLRVGSNVRDIPVELHKPEPVKSGGWRCVYTIAWPDGVRESEGRGVDGLQAFELTLNKIGTELYLSEYHIRGELIWERPGDGYGFPVPRNIRDMLIGSDKTEYGVS